MRLSRFAHFALALLLFCLLAVSASADAPKSGETDRTVTRTGPHGTSRTSTNHTTWQRGGGRWTRNTVHTGPAGKQTTTHVDGVTSAFRRRTSFSGEDAVWRHSGAAAVPRADLTASS